MSVKLANATVDQMAKAFKKAVKKSPEALSGLAAKKPELFNKSGNLSAKRIATAFLAENGDLFTKSGKLNDKGKLDFVKDGFKLDQSVKKVFKKMVGEFETSEKADKYLQKALESTKKTIANTGELAKKVTEAIQSSGKKLY